MPAAARRPGGLPCTGRNGGFSATGKITGASAVPPGSGDGKRGVRTSLRAGPSRYSGYPDNVEVRASDKIPGARVKVQRQSLAESSGARPREWLALAGGAIQAAKTEGPALALVGDPVPYRPGRAERRSGVPTEVITSDHVPNSCTCSWAYSRGKLTLKYYNAACSLHSTR